MKPRKLLNKFWNRHPIFYKVRFKLLLKEVDAIKLNKLYYNKYNLKKSIPKIFHDYNSSIFPDGLQNLGDMDKVIQIACWLRNSIKGGPGLGINSSDSLKYMIEGTYGICSDFSQIFNNFCVINDIKVREWGFNNMQFNGPGHSFNEFYCHELKKWVLIDISKSVYFYTEDQSKPLSVTEVFKLTRMNLPKNYYCFNPSYYPPHEKIQDLYYIPNTQPFLVDAYRNNVYDFYLKQLDKMPIPFVHGLIFILGKSYNYKKIELPAPVIETV